MPTDEQARQARYYRDCAEDIRQRANTLTTPEAADLLHELADNYERLAAFLESSPPVHLNTSVSKRPG